MQNGCNYFFLWLKIGKNGIVAWQVVHELTCSEFQEFGLFLISPFTLSFLSYKTGLGKFQNVRNGLPFIS